MQELNQLQSKARSKRKSHKKVLSKLKKQKDQKVDHQIQGLHEEVFEYIDCLSCANCCKTTGPLVTTKDIERISKHLKLSPQDFISQYLKIDEDNDYVMHTLPCPFLGNDNYCSIYEVRPKACREYPHTDRMRQKQLFSLHLKNAEICPAVFEVLEQIK